MKSSIVLRICQIACILSFFFLLTHSALILEYAKDGLSSWAFSVLPVLLPFIILSKFWIYYDVPQLFFHTARRMLPGHSRAALCLTVLLLGLSSGFPIGAIFVRHFYEDGFLAKREAEELLPLCSFVSPMFLMGYVRPLTGYKTLYWWLFALSLYLPLFLYFGKFLFAHRKHTALRSFSAKIRPSFDRKLASARNNDEVTANKQFFISKTESGKRKTEAGKMTIKKAKTMQKSTLRDVWLSSLEIIFTIGIYMMLFSILFGITLHEPLLRGTVTEVLLSNLEITTGIAWLSRMSAFSGAVRGALMAAVVSVGGLCTTAQVYSATFGCSFSMGRYLRIKSICALMSAVLVLLLWQIVC